MGHKVGRMRSLDFLPECGGKTSEDVGWGPWHDVIYALGRSPTLLFREQLIGGQGVKAGTSQGAITPI